MNPVLVIDVAHEAWRCVRESTTARPFASLLARIDALAAEHPRVILALDSPPYDRAAVLPSYKAHRTADPEARALVGAMLDGLRHSGRVIAEYPGAEADDICATIARWCNDNRVQCTIATSDKDLAPLIDIARVWDLRTGAEVTRESVRARWGVDPEQIPDMLALGGDESDGIGGVPGVGLTGAPPTKPGATRTIGGATILLQAFGSLANVLAREPWSAEQIASERKRRDKMRDAAKRAADKKEPDAEAQAALAAEMTRVINLEALVAKVHAHRAAVEQARALVALRYDVPIDVAALLAREPAQPQPITEDIAPGLQVVPAQPNPKTEERPRTMSKPSDYTFTATDAVREAILLRAGFCGPTGSGKTRTAIMLGCALVERLGLGPLFVIDSEHKSALRYAYSPRSRQGYRFKHVPMPSEDCSPAAYLAALEFCEAQGAGVVLIDSFSHMWAGIGGVLEQVDKTTEQSRSKNAFSTGWKEWTPIHARTIERIMQSPAHILFTLRAKQEWVIQENDRGKKEPQKMGLGAVAREGIDYEPDFYFIQEKNGGDVVLTVDKCRQMDRPRLNVGQRFTNPAVDFADEIIGWLEDGEPTADPLAAVMDRAVAEGIEAARAKDAERYKAAGSVVFAWCAANAPRRQAEAMETWKRRVAEGSSQAA